MIVEAKPIAPEGFGYWSTVFENPVEMEEVIEKLLIQDYWESREKPDLEVYNLTGVCTKGYVSYETFSFMTGFVNGYGSAKGYKGTLVLPYIEK